MTSTHLYSDETSILGPKSVSLTISGQLWPDCKEYKIFSASKLASYPARASRILVKDKPSKSEIKGSGLLTAITAPEYQQFYAGSLNPSSHKVKRKSGETCLCGGVPHGRGTPSLANLNLSAQKPVLSPEGGAVFFLRTLFGFPSKVAGYTDIPARPSERKGSQCLLSRCAETQENCF